LQSNDNRNENETMSNSQMSSKDNGNGNGNGNGDGNDNGNAKPTTENIMIDDDRNKQQGLSWIKHHSSLPKEHMRSQSMSSVGKLDMKRFQHLTKISISLTNSQRVVLEDKRDLNLSYRKQKQQQDSQPSQSDDANKSS